VTNVTASLFQAMNPTLFATKKVAINATSPVRVQHDRLHRLTKKHKARVCAQDGVSGNSLIRSLGDVDCMKTSFRMLWPWLSRMPLAPLCAVSECLATS
jgi:hypothetical protein